MEEEEVMFGRIASVCATRRDQTSNVFDEEREREVNRIFCAGACYQYQYLAERDKMQVQTVVL